MNKQEWNAKDLITYKEVLLGASSFLEKKNAEVYSGEWLMKEMKNWTKTEFLNHLFAPMPEEEKKVYVKYINEHAKGVPAQQLLGYAWFYDRKFMVTSDTLIPRPETEELVQHVLSSLPQTPQRILDIGTGTGAIACTLKAERMQDEVTAVDISEKALKVAVINAQKLQTPIRFLEGDLIGPVKGESFDVIVSNPPYIGEDEKGTLEENVRLHEPRLALFGGKDGLEIYRRLSEDLPSIMCTHTCVYLEIGFQQGKSVQNLMQNIFPDRTVVVLQDMSGKDRIIKINAKKQVIHRHVDN